MLKDKIKKDMITAMKEKNVAEKETLRGLLSSITNKLISNGELPTAEASDELVLTIIKTESKRRKDSIEQFEKGGRNDLAENEKKELEILENYLPEMMSEEEILKIATNKKNELKIEDKSKLGILIGAVIKETAGKSDGALVSKIVNNLF